MFKECSTLLQLNARRRELIQEGVSTAEVNSAYNKAKQELMSRKSSFRRPPKFTAERPESVPGFVPYQLIIGQVPKHVLVITGDTVSI